MTRDRRRFGVLVFATCFGAAASGEESRWQPVLETEMSQLHKSAVALPGIAVGLLVETNGTTRQTKENTDIHPAVFARDGDRRFIYLFAEQSEKASKQYFYVGQTGQANPFSNVVPATPSILRARGISKHFALIEVQVNEGKGSPPLPLGENFVASSIRVLDMTEQYPLDSSRAIDDAIERCHSRFAAIRAADPAFASAARSAFGDDKGITSNEILAIDATWLSQTERIRVDCHFRLIEDEFKYGRGVSPKEDHTDLPNEGIPYGRQAGVLVTVAFQADKTGHIEFAGQTAPVAFKTDIPPPGSALGSPPKLER